MPPAACVSDPPAYTQPTQKAGTPRGYSVRRLVSLPNQGFGVGLTSTIALIINYLGTPFGRAFTEWRVG